MWGLLAVPFVWPLRGMRPPRVYHPVEEKDTEAQCSGTAVECAGQEPVCGLRTVTREEGQGVLVISLLQVDD